MMELPDAFDWKSRNQIEIKMLPASARLGELVRCITHRGTQHYLECIWPLLLLLLHQSMSGQRLNSWILGWCIMLASDSYSCQSVSES